MGWSCLFFCTVCIQVIAISSQLISSSQECPGPAPPVGPMEVADPSLTFVYGIFRHGIRTPTASILNGWLTNVGKNQMYVVGQRLKERYGCFLGNYYQNQVFASSAGVQRTTMTALCVMAALYPPIPEIIPGLLWQPIPVKDDFILDKSIYLHEGNIEEAECPRLEKAVIEITGVTSSPDLSPQEQKIAELLQYYTKQPNITTMQDIDNVYDDIEFGCLNKVQPPAWATEPQPSLDYKALYPEVLTEVHLQFNRISFDSSKDLSLLLTGPFFFSLNEYFQNTTGQLYSINTNDTITYPNKLRFHGTHDDILVPLMLVLQINAKEIVDPGDGLVFELHQEGNRKNVRIFYYDALNGQFITEVESAVCPTPCSREEFAEAFPGLSPREWKTVCFS